MAGKFTYVTAWPSSEVMQWFISRQAYHQRSLATSAYFTALSNSQNPYFYNNNNNIYGYGIGVPDPNNPNNLPPQFNNINLQNAAAQQQQAGQQRIILNS